MKAIRNSLVWRHRMLWSYRFDVFCLSLVLFMFIIWFFGATIVTFFGPATVFVAVLLQVAVLAYYILKVFYTSRLYIVSAHPKFSIILAQFLFISLLTVCLANVAGAVLDPLFSDGPYFYLSPLMIFLHGILCFISIFVITTRLFDFSTAVTASVSAAALSLAALLMFPGAIREVDGITGGIDLMGIHFRFADARLGMFLAGMFVFFLLIFWAGMFMPVERSLCLSLGLIGAVVISSLLCLVVVSVDSRNLSEFFLLIALVYGVAYVTEFSMRRAMYRFLFEPQP